MPEQPNPHPYISDDLHPLVVEISTLSEMENNPRTHSDEGDKTLRHSLSQFRQLKPIVLHADGETVIAGNGTLKNARLLGWTHIAVVRSNLSGQEAEAFAIADNRTTDQSEFNMARVGKVFQGLDAALKKAIGFGDGDFDFTVVPEVGEAAEPPTESTETTTTTTTVTQQTYAYNLVFSNLESQNRFYDFARWLRGKYPDEETVADRINQFIVNEIEMGNGEA